jgi:hypothetical protein
LVLLSGWLLYGHLKMLNKVVKHTLTTTFTRLKAGLTKDNPLSRLVASLGNPHTT